MRPHLARKAERTKAQRVRSVRSYEPTYTARAPPEARPGPGRRDSNDVAAAARKEHDERRLHKNEQTKCSPRESPSFPRQNGCRQRRPAGRLMPAPTVEESVGLDRRMEDEPPLESPPVYYIYILILIQPPNKYFPYSTDTYLIHMPTYLPTLLPRSPTEVEDLSSGMARRRRWQRQAPSPLRLWRPHSVGRRSVGRSVPLPFLLLSSLKCRGAVQRNARSC